MGTKQRSFFANLKIRTYKAGNELSGETFSYNV